MKLSEYDPDTHAGPTAFWIVDVYDIKDAGRLQDARDTEPEIVVESPHDTAYAPEGTDAADLIEDVGGRRVEPDDEAYRDWEEKWRSVHGEDGL